MGTRPATVVLGVAALLAGLLAATPAIAQSTLPSPLPDIPIEEKELEGRSSVVVGSGARALGMGGAFLARADDASAASWNPAGLSYLRVPEASVVWGNTTQSRRDPDAGTVKDDFSGNGPDFLAAAYPVRIGAALGAVQLSFQRVFSFAGEREREAVSSGESRLFLTTGSGGLDVLALGTGLQVTRQLRVGATVNRWTNGFEQEQRRIAHQRRTQTIDLHLSGLNANLGVIYAPAEGLNLGAVFKSPFTAKVELARSRTDQLGAFVETQTQNSGFSEDVRIDFPGAFGVGASWRPLSTLTVSSDWTRTFWSGGRVRNYFLLERTPLGEPPPAPSVYSALPYPTLDDPDQQDTTQIRLGVEYVVLYGRLKWPVRAGYFSDWQYFRDANGATPRYDGFTVGTGLIVGPVLLDVAYLNEAGNYLEAGTPQHLVSTRLQRVFVSLIYRHAR